MIDNYFAPVEGTRQSQTKKNVTDEEVPATQDNEGKSESMDVVFDAEEAAKTDKGPNSEELVTRPQKRRRKNTKVELVTQNDKGRANWWI